MKKKYTSPDGYCIHIEGATQHNLKNIDVDIPRDKLITVCGPSGSGKSTLAFDIVYAEGQRRYVESLSAYARQFLPQIDKPKVKKIEGLSPAISLEQQTTGRNPRSTVGTVTETYDFLRVFYARLGVYYCPQCGKAIAPQSTDQIINDILSEEENTKFYLLAPLVEHQKGTHKDIFDKLKKEGFARVRVNKTLYALDEVPELEKNKKHSIDLVVDRLVIKADMKKRLADSIELALLHGNGRIFIDFIDKEEKVYSTQSSCTDCKISMPPLSPQLFSFNSPQGACQYCSGLGIVEYFEPELLCPNKGLSIETGAIIPWKTSRQYKSFELKLKELGAKYCFTLKTLLEDYSEDAYNALFFGDKDIKWKGVINLLEDGYKQSDNWRNWLSRFRQNKPCPHCEGARLRPETLAVKINKLSIAEFSSLSIQKALIWLKELHFEGKDLIISEPLLKELEHKLEFMVNVGLEYISLSRNMNTLSGGEAQRIRLASQLGSGLVGVTYVLDEPSIGLHPRDNERLINTLRSLQTRGNTVLVVEHDETTIRASDHIIELGPGSGFLGGEIMFEGTVEELLKDENSLTAGYLRGDLRIERPSTRRKAKEKITLRGVKTHNIKNIDVDIPLETFCCFTGVSGSGKSSLVVDSLYKHMLLSKGQRVDSPGIIAGITGAEKIEKIIGIDQSPIGRTPRSNPATYTKIFDDVRKIFAESKEAKVRGYQIGRFSFNVKGGRCEACSGDGQIKVEMHFLPDIYVTCEVCKGKRYNSQTLEVTYKEKNIAEVLDLTIAEAKEFFVNHSTLQRRLQVLEDVGLGYLHLGQPATTLSGGEAQRIKISRELGKKNLPGTMYILDEPTTGLHMHEVGKVISVLHQLVEKGATVIVIEHNTDMILSADYVFDLGPGGGEFGGEIVAQGTPEEIIKDKNSVTGKFLLENL